MSELPDNTSKKCCFWLLFIPVFFWITCRLIIGTSPIWTFDHTLKKIVKDPVVSKLLIQIQHGEFDCISIEISSVYCDALSLRLKNMGYSILNVRAATVVRYSYIESDNSPSATEDRKRSELIKKLAESA